MSLEKKRHCGAFFSLKILYIPFFCCTFAVQFKKTLSKIIRDSDLYRERLTEEEIKVVEG